MRLIDWDKVLEWMHRQKETLEQWSMRIAIENYVDEMPTVDAEPVVRCRDCRHFELQDLSNPKHNTQWCVINGFNPQGMDYCSYGERMDGEDGGNR